ncbi:MAG: RNA polymerase sigma factor [Clostridiales bacterium]|nr:RNA polymerase sigma factor [Clostridiales bacterium]
MSYFGEDVNQYLIEFKKEDRSRFNEFYDKYHDRLLTYAVLYLVNKDLCEDVMSESYIKMFRSINTFKEDEDGYNWLLKIIENTARTRNLKELKHKTVDIDKIYLPDQRDNYAESDIDMFLERVIKSKDYKNYVIAMLMFKGRKQEEIASMLGITKSAVCQRMSKIRAIIANNLKKD